MKRYWRIEPQNDEVLDDDVDKIKLKASKMNARALSLDMVKPNQESSDFPDFDHFLLFVNRFFCLIFQFCRKNTFGGGGRE